MRIRFGRFTLDTGREQLFADGREVPLTPKALGVLRLLIDHRPDVVDKDTIAAEVWRDPAVSDASLTVVLAEIRKALGDSAERPLFIRTAHRRGYAFCGDVKELDPGGAASGFWLTINDRTVLLGTGETILGRDPASGVRLNQPSVSWRHARVTVQGGVVAIEDLGSTNGTVVNGSPTTGRALLKSGDSIQLGEMLLRFEAPHTTEGPAKTLRLPGR